MVQTWQDWNQFNTVSASLYLSFRLNKSKARQHKIHTASNEDDQESQNKDKYGID